jgi:hypothetical protein
MEHKSLMSEGRKLELVNILFLRNDDTAEKERQDRDKRQLREVLI